MYQPLVSIAVATYNSSNTIVETLNSIYNQTYVNVELVISDDCSTDNTIELCERWISENKNRFSSIALLSSNENYGISKNFNLAEDACHGEWIKPLAGDDILVNDCIETCINFVINNPEATTLFGRCKSFGADDGRCRSVDSLFDYDFFKLTTEQQFKRLVFGINCVPASTYFFNKAKIFSLGVRNDERIPLLDDWPKWINLLRKGVKFYFIDEILVEYRVGGVSTSALMSVDMFYSDRLFYFYYLFPEWCKVDLDLAVKKMVESEVSLYKIIKEKESKTDALIRKERDILKIENKYLVEQLKLKQDSKSFKLGRLMSFPYRYVKKLFHSIK